MAKNPTIQFKRGDDFKLDLTVTDTNNNIAIAAKLTLTAAQADYDAAIAADPQVALDISTAQTALDLAQAAYDTAILVNITDWVIASQIRWCGKLVSDFTVIILDALNGIFTITADAANTQTWIPRVYEMDIEFIRPGTGKISSETLLIEVRKDITNGG